MKIFIKCRQIVIIGFLLCFSYNIKAQNTATIEQIIVLFEQLYENQNYEKASEYIDDIQKLDSLSSETLFHIVMCFEKLRKYKECIIFSEKWLDEHPDESYLFFYCELGVCNYLISEYQDAVYYFSIYVDESLKNGDKYDEISGMYAESLFNTYEYAKAEPYYEMYINRIMTMENISYNDISSYSDNAYLGSYLYNYAYCCFFQGKEQKGLELLLFSKRCGFKDAIDDYNTLSKSPTCGKEISYSKKIIREFEKYIKELNFHQDEDPLTQKSFWKAVEKQNPRYQEFKSALDKALNSDNPSVVVKNTVTQLRNEEIVHKQQLSLFYPFTVSDIEKRLSLLLCGESKLIDELRIFPSDDINAFATPFGEIYLTDDLVKTFHFNDALILGVLAHEMTHYICQHHAVQIYKAEKKERKNEIWAAVAAGINTAAHGAAAMSAASSGVSFGDDYWDNVTNFNESIVNEFRLDSHLFKYKYARSQELESDIIAYRFCEDMGIGGYVYIMGLQLLGDNNAYMTAEEESDHPTTAFRVGLLKYLHAKEHPLN